jgi:hypothetical protein
MLTRMLTYAPGLGLVRDNIPFTVYLIREQPSEAHRTRELTCAHEQDKPAIPVLSQHVSTNRTHSLENAFSERPLERPAIPAIPAIPASRSETVPPPPPPAWAVQNMRLATTPQEHMLSNTVDNTLAAARLFYHSDRQEDDLEYGHREYGHPEYGAAPNPPLYRSAPNPPLYDSLPPQDFMRLKHADLRPEHVLQDVLPPLTADKKNTPPPSVTAAPLEDKLREALRGQDFATRCLKIFEVCVCVCVCVVCVCVCVCVSV